MRFLVLVVVVLRSAVCGWMSLVAGIDIRNGCDALGGVDEAVGWGCRRNGSDGNACDTDLIWLVHRPVHLFHPISHNPTFFSPFSHSQNPCPATPTHRLHPLRPLHPIRSLHLFLLLALQLTLDIRDGLFLACGVFGGLVGDLADGLAGSVGV